MDWQHNAWYTTDSTFLDEESLPMTPAPDPLVEPAKVELFCDRLILILDRWPETRALVLNLLNEIWPRPHAWTPA